MEKIAYIYNISLVDNTMVYNLNLDVDLKP